MNMLQSMKLFNNNKYTTNTHQVAFMTQATEDPIMRIRETAAANRDSMRFLFTLSTFDRNKNVIYPTRMTNIIYRVFSGTTTTPNKTDESLDIEESALYHDAIVLTLITLIGLFGNGLTVITILTKKSLRNLTNMFLLHHCVINFIQSTLCIPFIIALLTNSQKLKGCEVFGGAYVTIVTTGILNIAAMVASEAYHFEDIVSNDHYDNESHDEDEICNGDVDVEKQKNEEKKKVKTVAKVKPKNKTKAIANTVSNPSVKSIKAHQSKTSYACVIFGVIMIWLASIILHLGITLIGSDPKQFYNHAIRNCFFIIGDKRTYILYVMWIVVTLLAISLIIKYVFKIYNDILKHKKLIASSCLKSNSIVSRNPDIDFSYFLIKVPLLPQQTSNGATKVEKNNNLLSAKRTNFKMKTNSLPLSTSFQVDATSQSRMKRFAFKPKSRSFSLTHLNNSNLFQTNNCSGTVSLISKQQREKYVEQARAKLKYKRNYDVIKQILQKIKIQFIVVIFFVICWLPLFITVIVDAKFEVSPKAYRYLTIIACSNSSITPYCYLTILVPKINKYCLPCLRTDGKRSRYKSKLYDAMSNYYEKVGDRFHNINSSVNSLHSTPVYQKENKETLRNGEIINEVDEIEKIPLKDSVLTLDQTKSYVNQIYSKQKSILSDNNSNSNSTRQLLNEAKTTFF